MSAAESFPVFPELASPRGDPELPLHIGQQALYHFEAGQQFYSNHLGYVAEGAEAASELALDMTQAHDRRLGYSLEAMRQGFGNLSASQQKVVGNYLHKLAKLEPQLSSEAAQPAALADPALTTVDELFEIARRHQGELEYQRTHPDVLLAISTLKADRLKKEEEGIARGWISSNARQSAHKVREVNVIISDVAKVAHGYAGYHTPGHDWIALSQGEDVGEKGVAELLARINNTLGHEINHCQFAHGLPFWEEEAMAEHVDLGLEDNGYLSVMDPEIRRVAGMPERGRLAEARKLKYIELTAVPTRFSDDERIKQAVLAYTSGSLNSIETHAADAIIDASWRQPDMRGYITRGVATYEEEIIAERQARIDEAIALDKSVPEIMALQFGNWEVRDEAMRRMQQHLLHKARALYPKAQHLDDAVRSEAGQFDPSQSVA